MTMASEVALGDIAEFIRGINFKPDDVVPLGTEGSVGCMRTKNVQDELDCSDVWAVPKEFVRREEQMLAEGDILVSSANSWNLVGKCSWIPRLEQPSSFGGFVSVLRAKPDRVEPRFLYRWFSWDRTQALLRSFGQKTTNISNLNIERCLNLNLCLPPLPEQRRIAAILDQAEALRAKRREALAQLDELQRAIFMEMFGDPVTSPKGCVSSTLGDCVEEMQYGPRFYNEAYSEEGIRIVRITDLNTAGSLDFDAMPRMDVDAETQTKFVLSAGDIVFARTGATVGKVALMREGDPPCIAGAYFIRMRFQKHIIPEYAYSVLQSSSVQSLIAGQSRQAAQQNFSGPGLRRLPMPIPALERQTQFAQRLEAIRNEKIKHLNGLGLVNDLFSSLQHRAFRGEL